MWLGILVGYCFDVMLLYKLNDYFSTCILNNMTAAYFFGMFLVNNLQGYRGKPVYRISVINNSWA
jgi:hypothetical protein